MTGDEVREIFQQSGAYLEGHFELTSGLHSSAYVEKFRVLERPELAGRLCGELASRLSRCGAQVVMGPAVGGIIVAYEVARYLGLRAIFAERAAGGLELRRGFSVVPGEKVLVVEDVVTTGGSLAEAIECVLRAGGEVVGAGLLVDRSGGKLDLRGQLGAAAPPLEALLRLDLQAWPAVDCPLCKEGQPVRRHGSRLLALAQPPPDQTGL